MTDVERLWHEQSWPVRDPSPLDRDERPRQRPWITRRGSWLGPRPRIRTLEDELWK